MTFKDFIKWTFALILLSLNAKAEEPLYYLIYGEAAEPYQIQGEHLGTGVISDLLSEIFKEQPNKIVALSLPTQRIRHATPL